ncbi:hypothetical protein MUK42_07919 [Musa troglodytarum]|uniref:Inhibitor I9 domain-containing protein n=1 Tax=Musa troglodytarum TaxID=320322 RepID=A0A9E7EYD0_9LILI|nr:hypothetical protein MUK42_07919 [Musa troglodytarum]
MHRLASGRSVRGNGYFFSPPLGPLPLSLALCLPGPQPWPRSSPHHRAPCQTSLQCLLQLLSLFFWQFDFRQEEAEEAMVYSYRHGFSGFAAMLNSTQASTLASEHITISIQALNHHPPLLNAPTGTALAGFQGVM